MAVGYAAFSSQLKISGTSNIASNFLVKITSITPNSIIGTASSLYYWIINASSYESGGYSNTAWYGTVNSSYVYVNSNYAYAGGAPRLVVFLKAVTTLSGNGTLNNPFTIVQ